MVTTVVNLQQELRTCFNDHQELGYWEAMNPSYTVFHQDTHTFSSLWTEYTDDFNEFYQNIQVDIEKYANDEDLFPKPDCPTMTIGKYLEQGNTLQYCLCFSFFLLVH